MVLDPWADAHGYMLPPLRGLKTVHLQKAPKGECHLTLEDIAQHATGLLAGLVPPSHGEAFSLDEAHRYRDIFDETYLLAELHQGPHDCYRRGWLQDPISSIALHSRKFKWKIWRKPMPWRA